MANPLLLLACKSDLVAPLDLGAIGEFLEPCFKAPEFPAEGRDRGGDEWPMLPSVVAELVRPVTPTELEQRRQRVLELDSLDHPLSRSRLVERDIREDDGLAPKLRGEGEVDSRPGPKVYGPSAFRPGGERDVHLLNHCEVFACEDFVAPASKPLAIILPVPEIDVADIGNDQPIVNQEPLDEVVGPLWPDARPHIHDHRGLRGSGTTENYNRE